MYDFEKLQVYQKAKQLNREVIMLLHRNSDIEKSIKDQFVRASISIVLNLAEGTGKFTPKGRKNFYTISRGSIYECVSIIEILEDCGYITHRQFMDLYMKYNEVSKMVYGLIRAK